jgi:DNA-binding Lrp family transcriptional regulator
MTVTSYEHVITCMRAELAEIDQRRNHLLRAIEAIEQVSVATMPPAQPAAKERRSRPPSNVEDPRRKVTDAALLAYLQEDGPVAPAIMAKHFEMSVAGLRTRLQILESAGSIVITGTTNSRRVLLPPAAHVAPAPMPTAPTPNRQTTAPSPLMPAASSPSTALSSDAAEAIDAAIKARLRNGKASRDELLRSMPSTVPDAAKHEVLHRALRRLTLKKQIFDVGDKFQLAT